MVANFLWYSGTSGFNGLTATSVTIISTEAFGLGSSLTAISAVTGTSSSPGIFTSSMFGQAPLGEVFMNFGSSLTALTAGSNISGWFMVSPDNGTTFESTTYQNSSAVGLARPPDWTIPIASTAAIGSSAICKGSAIVRIPALPFKVMIQNNTQQTIASSSGPGYPTIKLAPFALQY